MVDYSRANVLVAKVVVKAMYRVLGKEPLGVELCLSPAAREEVWEREAKKYLVEQYRRKHYGLRPMTPRDVEKLQEIPGWWDELAGDKPGEEEQSVKKTSFYCDPALPFRTVES